jgi:hypothetical protein
MVQFDKTAAASTLVVLYLASRLTHLARLPVFIDEAIHIGWARETLAGHWEAGMLVGKWLPVKVMALFLMAPLHPLVAARLGSVVAGAATLLAILFIGRSLFSLKEGYLAGLLYVLIPFALLYDRLALADSYLTAFGAWAIYFSVRTVVHGSRLGPWLLAATLVAAVLSKLTGALYLAIPLLAVLLLSPRQDWAQGLRRVTPALLPPLIVLVYLVQREAGTQLLGNQVGLELGGELIRRSLANSADLAGWLWMLLTPPVALLSVVAMAWAFAHLKEPAVAFLLAILVTTTAAYVVASDTWFPRYVLFALAPLALLMGRFLVAVYEAVARAAQRSDDKPAGKSVAAIGVLALVALLTWPAVVGGQWVFEPPKAALPQVERWQYVTGWPSGYGVPELAIDLESFALSNHDGINVVRFDFWNPPNQSLDVYLVVQPSLHLYTLQAGSDALMQRMQEIAGQRQTYFVAGPRNHGADLVALGKKLDDLQMPWTIVGEYKTPDDQTALELWKIEPAGVQ